MIKLKDFLVESFMSSKIYEMADDRRRYADKIEDTLPQIIENVCLIVYVKTNKETNQNLSHWLHELNAHIYSLRKRKVKVTKSRIFHDVLDAIDYDQPMIRNIIRMKFNKERFNIDHISYQDMGKIVQFLNRDLVEICCKPFQTQDHPDQETYMLIVDALEELFGFDL